MQSNLKFEELKVWMFMLSNLFLIFLKKSEYKIVSEIITEPVLTGCSKIQINRINQPTYFFAILDRTVFFSHLGVCVYELFRSYQHKAKRFREVIIEILSRLSVHFLQHVQGNFKFTKSIQGSDAKSYIFYPGKFSRKGRC